MLKIIDMKLSSAPQNLVCSLSMIGIPDLLALDKASYDFHEPPSSTKTVKTLISEVASGDPVNFDLTEEQTTNGASQILNVTNNEMVGQKVNIVNRTIKTLSFNLQRVGLCGGSITFRIINRLTEEYLASAVWGDASAIDNVQNAWYTVTFDTPILVNQEVWLVCHYQPVFSDDSNYIRIYYSPTDVKGGSSECLYHMVTDEAWEEVYYQDCRYRYTYTGVGIDCFTKCAPYAVVYDSEDSLIGSYMPKDSFVIYQNDDRLSVINKLLSYTRCEKRVEDDGKIHIFVPTTTGTTYDYEYSLAKGYHNFFSKGIRDALVIPNAIHVESLKEDSTFYYGEAFSTVSFALWSVYEYVQMRLTSDAQALAIATAMVSRLEVESQKGSAIVPMNIGQEIFDYVKITDAIEGDTKTGNIGYIRRTWTPDSYNMLISFGKVATKSVKGTRPSLMPENRYKSFNANEQNVTWGSFSEIMTHQVNEIWKGGINDGKEYAGINDLVDYYNTLSEQIQETNNFINNVILVKINEILTQL